MEGYARRVRNSSAEAPLLPHAMNLDRLPSGPSLRRRRERSGYADPAGSDREERCFVAQHSS